MEKNQKYDQILSGFNKIHAGKFRMILDLEFQVIMIEKDDKSEVICSRKIMPGYVENDVKNIIINFYLKMNKSKARG